MREGRAAAQLRHPNIVSVFDAGELNGQHYLAIEFVSGSPLSELGSNRSYSPQQAAKMIADLARALHYAHSHKIIHRDIKPHNIVLNEKGLPQILDFGLAKSLADKAGLTIDGTVMGTPAYMSPEQARGDLKNVGPASDQYSLGATLYWLLTGQALFSGPPGAVIAQVVSVEPQPPQKFASNLDDRLAAICQKSISKLPSDRYSSCLEMARDLERYLNDEVVQARPIGAVGRAIRWAGRNRFDAGLAIATSLLLILSTVISLIGYTRSRTLLSEASQLENTAQTTLDDIERTKSELERQSDVLSEAKSRSEQAKIQLVLVQRSAEESQAQLKKLVAENEVLQTKSKSQLELISKNEAQSLEINSLAEKTQSEAEQAATRALGVQKQLESIFKSAFTAIDNQDFTGAEKILAAVDPKFRDCRWQLQTNVIKRHGELPFVKKKLADITEKNERNHAKFKLCGLDSSANSLQLQLTYRQAAGNTTKFIFLNTHSGSQLAKSVFDPFPPQHQRSRIITSEISSSFVCEIAHADPKHRRLLEIRHFEERSPWDSDGNGSRDGWKRSINAEIWEVSSRGNHQLRTVPGQIDAVFVRGDGEIVAIVQQINRLQMNSDEGLGKWQIGGRIQIISLSAGLVEWDITKEASFQQLIRPEYANANFERANHTMNMNSLRGSLYGEYAVFEYSDSRLEHDMIGFYSIRDKQIKRLVSTHLKHAQATSTASPTLHWSDAYAPSLLAYPDEELSQIRLPPKDRNYWWNTEPWVHAGGQWVKPTLSGGVITLGNTPIHRIKETLDGKIVQAWVSSDGDVVAYLTETELLIVTLGSRDQIVVND